MSQKIREKRPKKTKDPNVPKMPLNSFFLYCKNERQNLRNKYPDLSYKEIFNLMVENWHKRDLEECRKKYENLSQIEFDRYHKEKKEAEELKKMCQNPEIEKKSLIENPKVTDQFVIENQIFLTPLAENKKTLDPEVSNSLTEDKMHYEGTENEQKLSIESRVEEKKSLDNQVSKTFGEEKSLLDNNLAEKKMPSFKKSLEKNQKSNKREGFQGKEVLLRFDLKKEEQTLYGKAFSGKKDQDLKNLSLDPQVIY